MNAPQQHPQAPHEPQAKPPRSTRTSPIVWGALVLALCAYAAQRVFGSGGPDAAWWIIAIVIGLGALLLVVGAAVLVRSRGAATSTAQAPLGQDPQPQDPPAQAPQMP